MNRRAKLLLAIALVIGAALVAAAAVVARPGYEDWKRRAARRADLARLLVAPDDSQRAEKLVAYSDEPEAVIALIERAAADPSLSALQSNPEEGPDAGPWRRAIELWAIEPRDPRPLDLLVTLSRNESFSDHRRLELLYLIEELKAPTYQDALDLPSRPMLAGMNEEVIASIQSIVAVDFDEGFDHRRRTALWSHTPLEDSPARALARIAQELDARLVRRGDRWRVSRNKKESSTVGSMDTGTDRESWTKSSPDPQEPKIYNWVGVDITTDTGTQTWWLLGQAGTDVRVHPNHMEPVKFFRALAALRGYSAPRQIAERVFETAHVSSGR